MKKDEAIKLLKLAREIIMCSPFLNMEDQASVKFHKAARKFMNKTKHLPK